MWVRFVFVQRSCLSKLYKTNWDLQGRDVPILHHCGLILGSVSYHHLGDLATHTDRIVGAAVLWVYLSSIGQV